MFSLELHQLHTAILRPALLGAVVSRRFGIPETSGGQPRLVDSVGAQPVLRRGSGDHSGAARTRGLEATTIYLHLSRRHLEKTVNPLEHLSISAASDPVVPPAKTKMSRPAVEVAHILRAQGGCFLDRYHKSFSFQQLKAFHAIQHCRTAALGGYLDTCLPCGHQAISHNSCRNRHCPKCQAKARQQWIHARERELLATPLLSRGFHGAA